MRLVVIGSGQKGQAALILLIVAAFLLQCGTPAGDPSPQPYLVLYAFDAEGQLIAERMSVARTDRHLGRSVLVGRVSGKEIVLAEAGIGMTNAAMTTQRMIDAYDPCAVILTGIAGAVDTSIRIGDIVVPESWMAHDYGYYGSGGLRPEGMSVYVPGEDGIVDVAAFQADSLMLSRAEHLKPDQVGLEQVSSGIPRVIVGGVGVTGNTFIDSRDKREWLSSSFRALTVDMESAAVAQVCTINSIPFAVFRSASDLAGGSGSETAREEITRFFEIAATNSSSLVLAFLAKL